MLARAVAILDVVERTPMGSSELARQLGLSVPTAHRLAASMVKLGLLHKDAEGRHHLGPRFASSALSAVAGPVLDELRRDTGETAQLWVRRGGDRLCLASIESTEELRASVPVGTLLPLADGGSAAEVLTASPESRRPWVESVGRRTPGLCSVSAGVHLGGDVVAALCLSAPIFRVGEDGPGARYGQLVVSAAQRLENAVR